ncbi:MAG: hypothetical protein H7233_16515, partial [Pseudorhodobacter sp.]|nr:hypothetical protein [Frankiaceae bacterium]
MGVRVRDWAALAALGRGSGSVVVVTVGTDLALLVLFMRVLAPRARVVLVDVLLPGRRPWWLRLAARQIHHVVCIRRHDRTVFLERLGVPMSKSSFVHWPAPAQTETRGLDEGYLYSAGWAHRDWKTLLAAMAGLEHPLRLSADLPRDIGSGDDSDVTVLGMLSPADGRAMMSTASAVVLPFVD